jgi:PilZ domain
MSGMVTGPEQRRAMRVDVPKHFRGGELEPHFVHLLNLSLLGVRIAHLEPWPEGVVCSVALPPALGVLRLPGRVVWTRLRATERILEGDTRSLYASGIEFTSLTSEQQATLALALATFRAAQAGLGDGAADSPPEGPQGSSP